MLHINANLGVVLSAANRDPLRYEWYKVVSNTKTKMVFGDTIMELSNGEKFGLNVSRGKIFIIDASDMTRQYAADEKAINRLLKRSQGFRGKIEGVKVSAGKATSVSELSKPASSTATKPKTAPADRKPKSIGVKRRPRGDDVPTPVLPAVKEKPVVDKPVDNGGFEEEDGHDFEDESDPFEGIPKAQGRIRKRTPTKQLMEEEEQEEARTRQARNAPKPSSLPKASVAPSTPTSKAVKVVHLAHKPTGNKRTPAIEKTAKTVQALAIAMLRKENTLPMESRKVLKWLDALADRETDLHSEFAVLFPNKRKWPTSAAFSKFLEHCLQYAHNRTVATAVGKIEEDPDLVLTTYADYRFLESAWRANILQTTQHVEDVLQAKGFELGPKGYIHPMSGEGVSMFADYDEADTGVELTIGQQVMDGSKVKRLHNLTESIVVPVGKKSNTAISKLIQAVQDI